jgi:hypothetical protein
MEAVVAEGLSKTMKILSQDSRSSGPDSNKQIPNTSLKGLPLDQHVQQETETVVS